MWHDLSTPAPVKKTKLLAKSASQAVKLELLF